VKPDFFHQIFQSIFKRASSHVQDISTVLSSYYREGGLHHLWFEEVVPLSAPLGVVGRVGMFTAKRGRSCCKGSVRKFQFINIIPKLFVYILVLYVI
jgi:hypothetical protein